MNDPAAIGASVARNLKAERQRRRWSLDDLAGRSGISKGMLVQIEGARTNPSIATLCKLANALGVALPRIVEVTDEPAVRRITRAEVAWLWSGRRRESKAGLVGGAEDPIPVELWDWRIAPRDGYDGVAHPPGTREILFVLDGVLALRVDGALVSVAAGESAVFRADRPHRYAAAGRATVRFVMVVIEPISEAGPTARRAAAPRKASRPSRGTSSRTAVARPR